MSIEPIGIASFLLGLVCLLMSSEATAIMVAITSVFGAAAAVIIGAANIQPGHVLLCFLAIGVISRQSEAKAFIQALSPGQSGFWLLMLTLYGVLSAYFAPRLLEGQTQIFALGTTIYPQLGIPVPLVSVSTNVTQSVYMVSNVLCFGMAAALASTHRGFYALLSGLLAFCVFNIGFAFLDIATYSTGTQFLLGFMRNAQYLLRTEDQVAGLRRIVGSFTESSQFAHGTLGAFGFCATLWVCGYRPYLTFALAVVSLVLLVLSTSSTGLAGAPVVGGIVYLTALTLKDRQDLRPYTMTILIIIPLLALAAGLWILIDPVLYKVVYNYLYVVVMGKASTSSGIERGSWNVVGMQNFRDSFGFGVGLGTARTSSLLVALVATVGIPGSLFYALFTYGVLFRRRYSADSFTGDVRLAARNGCLGLILADILVSPVLDQGLFFYLLAAMASSQYGTRTSLRSTGFVGAMA